MMVNKKSHQKKKRIWIIIEFLLPIIVGFFNPNLEIGISLGILLWDLLMEEDKHQAEITPCLIEEKEEANN